MLAASTAVLVIGALLMLLALGGLAWAWSAGQLRGSTDQATVIFDPEDRRYERPWETSPQREARILAHGSLLPPEPGQWGGSR
ncbi:MAG: hypothetical protein H7338_06125 [Candidatus Sericytochromatia bacterium]|nr:hypothetical protein [Candidatus Sericytochromatia bacterium]